MNDGGRSRVGVAPPTSASTGPVLRTGQVRQPKTLGENALLEKQKRGVRMPTLGVDVVVVDAGRVLLTKRADFAVWCLPGGGVDAGETVAQAAIREAHEETGIQIELTRLVGIYSRPRWRKGGDHDILFLAKPVSGLLTPAVGEVVAVDYFDPDNLPEPLLAWHRQRIIDALNGVSGVVCLQDTPWPFPEGLSFQELSRLQDQMGVSKQEALLMHFTTYDSSGDSVEVDGK